ncbi:MAG: flavodoxin family protein [Kiritimatiellae bacterium]|nr:flavodoxin family protein [Kiritimatiellia bacterium]
MARKILILNGGPRLAGNTMELVKAFTRGAEGAGCEVVRFDLDRMDVHGCKGCLCGGKDPDSPCVQKDDMAKVYPAYRAADVVVFASPMYYWGVTGQLKVAIDRLFAVTESDPNWATPKKAVVLLMASEGAGAENAKPVLDYYRALAGFLGWRDLGHVVAGGNLRLGDIAGKAEIDEARALGASVGGAA